MKTSLLKKLGIEKKNDMEANGELAAHVAKSLPGIEEDRLRHLAAFGGLLGAVAYSDGNISSEEEQRIGAILEAFTDLNENEATLVQQIIREQTKSLSGLEDYIYTRELNELLSEQQKLEVLSCLFAVAAADDDISPEENKEIQRISSALLLHHDDFIRIRSLYRDKLSTLKNMPK